MIQPLPTCSWLAPVLGATNTILIEKVVVAVAEGRSGGERTAQVDNSLESYLCGDQANVRSGGEEYFYDEFPPMIPLKMPLGNLLKLHPWFESEIVKKFLLRYVQIGWDSFSDLFYKNETCQVI